MCLRREGGLGRPARTLLEPLGAGEVDQSEAGALHGARSHARPSLHLRTVVVVEVVVEVRQVVVVVVEEEVEMAGGGGQGRACSI